MPKLKLTLKAWPVIAIATIGLCFITEQLAALIGVKLPEQTNVELVRKVLLNALDSSKGMLNAAFLIGQVVLLMPALEEFVFRYLLFKLPGKLTERLSNMALKMTPMILSSAIFSAAHYLAQPWPDNAFLALFFFGLAQCWLYKKTEHLWCSVLNHALFNLTNLALLLILPPA